jgi:hypothetical protein
LGPVSIDILELVTNCLQGLSPLLRELERGIVPFPCIARVQIGHNNVQISPIDLNLGVAAVCNDPIRAGLAVVKGGNIDCGAVADRLECNSAVSAGSISLDLSAPAEQGVELILPVAVHALEAEQVLPASEV